MNNNKLIQWLLAGDVSIQYQVMRDLLTRDRKNLQKQIATRGWGAQYLAKRRHDGHWGMKFYQPKWTSSHYTLLDLRNLCITPDHPLIRESVEMIAKHEKGVDGGINPSGTINASDVCINGMFLNYACYFKTSAEHLHSVVDFIISQIMPDGGFNCRLNRSGAVHSSLHTTLSVLEGITEYRQNGYQYRLDELEKAGRSATEFILEHRLFLSDKTGQVINKDFLRLSFPGRWRYDILRVLDHFQHAGLTWDDRMKPALDVLLKKRNKDMTWNVQARHPGAVHFEMEKAGKPSRWNTLRALRVLKHFNI